MLRVGLIGYGAWGTHHARVITGCAEASLAGIAAKSEATAAQARNAHPEARVVTDWRELLELDIEAAVVVLPSHLHFEVGKAVLESGRHLLLEKPMALTVADCEALIALAKKGQRVLAIGHELRVSSLWGKVKVLIDAGAIGDPLYALIELWRRPYRLGADGWRYDIGRVGTWILEEPIHFFDLARWYFQKAGEPTAVDARANARRSEHPELHDHFSAIVDFPGGRYAVITQALTGWEHHQTVKVGGSAGSLWAAWSGAMDRTLEPTFSLRLQQGDRLTEAPIARPAGEVFELEAQFARFVQAIKTGAEPAATGQDGRWAVALCQAAQESVLSGQKANLQTPAP